MIIEINLEYFSNTQAWMFMLYQVGSAGAWLVKIILACLFVFGWMPIMFEQNKETKTLFALWLVFCVVQWYRYALGAVA